MAKVTEVTAQTRTIEERIERLERLFVAHVADRNVGWPLFGGKPDPEFQELEAEVRQRSR